MGGCAASWLLCRALRDAWPQLTLDCDRDNRGRACEHPPDSPARRPPSYRSWACCLPAAAAASRNKSSLLRDGASFKTADGCAWRVCSAACEWAAAWRLLATRCPVCPLLAARIADGGVEGSSSGLQHAGWLALIAAGVGARADSRATASRTAD